MTKRIKKLHSLYELKPTLLTPSLEGPPGWERRQLLDQEPLLVQQLEPIRHQTLPKTTGTEKRNPVSIYEELEKCKES